MPSTATVAKVSEEGRERAVVNRRADIVAFLAKEAETWAPRTFVSQTSAVGAYALQHGVALSKFGAWACAPAFASSCQEERRSAAICFA